MQIQLFKIILQLWFWWKLKIRYDDYDVIWKPSKSLEIFTLKYKRNEKEEIEKKKKIKNKNFK